MLANILTTLLVAGTALAAPAPAPTTEPTCGSRAAKLTEWTVVDLDFHGDYTFTTPAHQNSWGYINFVLRSPGFPYEAKCSAASSQLSDFFYGNVEYKCDVPNAADSVTFTFSRPDNKLSITQEWSCPDEGSRFTAKGCVTLPLECSESKYQNPDWQAGEIYSTRNIYCGLVTVKAPVQEIYGVA